MSVSLLSFSVANCYVCATRNNLNIPAVCLLFENGSFPNTLTVMDICSRYRPLKWRFCGQKAYLSRKNTGEKLHDEKLFSDCTYYQRAKLLV